MKFDPAAWGPHVIALVITCTFCSLIFFAAKFGIGDNQSLQQLIGALTIGFGSVTNYYLGSSISSKGKDAVIAQMANGPTNGGAGTVK